MKPKIEEIMQELIRQETEEELARCTVKKMCLQCGQPLPDQVRGRPRKFCSDACRQRWHTAHPNVKNWSSAHIVICPECGREFLASREYGHKRKYCSHACANRARAGKEGKNGNSRKETGS